MDIVGEGASGKGRAWQEEALTFLDYLSPSSPHSHTEPSSSLLAQMKDMLVNKPRNKTPFPGIGLITYTMEKR